MSAGITQYNSLASKGATEQQAFSNAVTATNTSFGKYLAGLNGGKASLVGYGASLVGATVKTIGLTAASVALNAAVSMGVSVIITGLISAFTAWINKSEEITQKAQEAADKINSISDSLKANSETVENTKKRYAELAQEVENLGKTNQSKGTLSNEEYQEFLNLSNQLAGVFPSLTKNYDENGNAILSLSGDVNTIVGSLDSLIKKEKELANQKMMEAFPDVYAGYVQDVSGAESKVKSAKATFDKINNAYQQLSKGEASQAFDLQGNGWFENEGGERVNVAMAEYISNLEALGIKYKKTTIMVKNNFGGDSPAGYLIEAMGDIDTAFTSKLETARSDLQYAQQQLEGQKSSINSYLNTWLQTEFSYNQIKDTGLQSAIQEMLFNFDFSTLPDNIDKNDWSAVSEYLRKNIIFAINNVQDNPEISKALSDLFTNQELSPERANNLIKQIQNYFGKDNPISVFLQPQFEENENTQKQVDSAISKFGEDSRGDLKTFFEKNSINTQDEVDKWNEITKGTNNATDAMNAYTEAQKNANKMMVSIADLEAASDKIKTLGSAFKELSEDGYITTKTLGEIQTATGLSGDEWTEYQNKLMSAKAGSSEFNQVMSDLTYKILDTTFAGKDLNNVSEEYVASVLKENGVVNASAVAHDYLNRKKAELKAATLLSKINEDDFADSIKNVATECGLTTTAIAGMMLKMINLNETKLDLSQQIAEITKLRGAMGLSTEKLTSEEIYKMGVKWVDTPGGGGYSYNGKWYNHWDFNALYKDVWSDKTDSDFGNTTPPPTVPNYSGAAKDSKSDKNKPDYETPTDAIINRINLRANELEQQEEYIQNALEIAEIENDYEKQISLTNDLISNRKKRVEELNKANANLHNEAEWLRSDNKFYNKDGGLVDTNTWFNSLGEATEEYISFYNSQSSKEDQERVKDFFESVSKYKKAWVENDKELTSLASDIFKDEHGTIPQLWEELMDDSISDIEHEIELRQNANPKDHEANVSDYEKIKEMAHARAEAWRAAGKDANSEEVQKWQKTWWDAQNSIWDEKRKEFDERLKMSDDYIQHSKDFGWKNGDTEIAARKRVLEWIQSDYYKALIKDDEEYYAILEENTVKYHEALKDGFGKANSFASSYLNAEKTLLQAHYDATNSIAEAQHEINKELETSQMMYQYLDEDTRKLLFNQEDYNTLSAKLLDIQNQTTLLQSQYKKDLDESTLETVEKITSQYEMQYSTLMKSYEIAKADLEVAKKKQKLNNVLNERNVRMFVNGSWQWVANTEDVINAKAELADAEYAKQVAEAGLTQKKSIDALTERQDNLNVVIKKFEDGIIDLQTAVGLAKDAIGSMPDALYYSYVNLGASSVTTYPSSSSYGGSSGGSVNKDTGVYYSASQIASMSAAERSEAWHGASEESKYYLHEANKAEMSESYDYDADSGTWKKKKEYAKGTRYTEGGLSLMGEEGFEAFVTSDGQLVPINQPTLGNIASGGIVFNTEQMKNLRTMWDMSNFNLSRNTGFIGGVQPQQIDQSQDNRIIINGMTVDSGSADGQALISALKRYVGNH